MSFATPPEYFIQYLGSPNSDRWPQLNALKRKTLNAGNYNHWFFFEVNRLRKRDSFYYLSQRPWAYVSTVIYKSFPQFFSASTMWHPHRNRKSGPHYQHRETLGRYEKSYNFLVHEFLFAPFGIYVCLFLGLVWCVYKRVHRQRFIWLVILFHIVYMTSISSLLTWGENARYRYIIEPFIWLVICRFLLDMFRVLKKKDT